MNTKIEEIINNNHKYFELRRKTNLSKHNLDQNNHIDIFKRIDNFKSIEYKITKINKQFINLKSY